MVRLGIPDDQPVGVQQWRGLIAINYPARRFGITRHMTAEEAKKKCPTLQTVHVATYREGDAEPGRWDDADPRTHKVSLDPYRRESSKIIAIFKSMVTEGEVEKASIDEAFLDLSILTIKEIIRRHPHLAVVPPDAPQGIDSPLPPPPPISWTEAGNVFPIEGEKQDSGNNDDHDGNDGEISEGVGGWDDVALCIGAELMARLCSAWKKPNAQIRNLGGKLGEAMATEYNASTVGDMLLVPLEEMQKRFGEESIWVYNILRGIDDTPDYEMHGKSQTGYGRRALFLVHAKNLSAEYITKYANKLWDEVADAMSHASSSKPMKINNLALSFYGLERLEGGQQGIEGFFGSDLSTSSKPMLRTKRSRSGSPSVKSLHHGNSDPGPSTKKKKVHQEVIEILDDSDDNVTEMDSLQWICPKCSRVFSVAAVDEDSSEATSTKQARLSHIKREHQDFHVAKELHKRERHRKVEDRHQTASTTTSKRATKPAKKTGGIKAFFSPFDTSSDSKN
ncbi:hypothetical protein QFC21_003375 [Naganishia friedmannii]|uniref:Uncharacterized protein n=1 Tax=Naganishia friedmannii TaxID=89922 RepID=A0ACC2VQH3_9TREE|nr:hypothetical protein QFC21_003375 [Naganishia friedmannii]